MDMNLRRLGENIRKLRRGAGFNQMDLVGQAHRLGVSVTQSHLSKVETGKTTAGADLLIALARLFKVTPNALFGVTDEAAQSPAMQLLSRLPVHRQLDYFRMLEPLVINDLIRERNQTQWQAVMGMANAMGVSGEITTLLRESSGGEKSLAENAG